MTTTRRGARRRRGAVSYRKLAISIPAELAAAVERKVRRGQLPSVSAFVSDALEEKLERDLFDRELDRVFALKPMTTRERTWADKILGT